MCGFSGLVSLNNKKDEIKRDVLVSMGDTIKHRGPDDSGIYINPDNSIGLSFRRLSIIDLADGHQPMHNENQTISLVFNGEIYNWIDLRDKLSKKGFSFNTQCDTESIIHGYNEWGIDVVRRLRGMFSFAIWDENKKQLMLARDRLGIKPLYYYHDDNYFVFGSEIKAILELSFIKKDICDKALYHYLTLAVTPAPETMFNKIKKLEPGHFIIIKKDGDIEKKQYWSPIRMENNLSYMSEENIIDKLRFLLRESIKLRLMSDVPFGVFLSGGLDSTLNVAMMNQLIDARVNTFSVAIKDDLLSNELDEANKVSKYFDTIHHELLIDHKDMIDAFPDIVKHQDEPLADPVCIPLYFVSKLAKGNKTPVIQIGEGADEIFSGYSLYGMMSDFNDNYYLRFMKLPRFIKNNILMISKFLLSGEKAKYIEWAANNIESFWGGVNNFSEKEKQSILKTPTNHDTYHHFISNHYEQFDNKIPSATQIDRIIYLEIKHRLPELLLMRVDKMAMAHSIETRVPFLDHKLVEFALNIPSKFKYRNGSGKDILKRAARGIVPDFVIDRKKTGFCGSATNMISGAFLDYAENVVINSNWVRHTFNMKYIKPIFNEHRNQYKDHGMKIFSMLNLAVWHQNFFGK